MSEFFGLKVGLDEMQRTLERQLASMDSLKAAIWSYFNGISLLVALVGALQVFAGKAAPGWEGWYALGIGAVIVLYGALLVLFMVALQPVVMSLPIASEWSELIKAFDHKTENETTAMLLSAVLNAIDLNRPIVKRFTTLSRVIGLLFGLTVIALFLLALIPRV